MNKYGIDVSQHQGVINWEKVKNQIDFAILRIGWIGNKNNHTIDLTFDRNYNECKRLNIPVGCYVYNYCNSNKTIKDGAKWVLEQIKGKDFELPIYLDMEDASITNLGKTKLTEMTEDFLEIIKTGFKNVGVYANLNWFNNYLNKEKLKKYNRWIAHYVNAIDKYNGEYDIWQFSSKERITGILGNVDANYCYFDFNKKEENKQELKTNEEIAKEVIDGLWGNGEERKKLLENAGYSYETIQKLINDMINNKYFPKCNEDLKSLVDALKSISVDSSLNNRKLIAKNNGINNYTGTSLQNLKLLKLLKQGLLING